MGMGIDLRFFDPWGLVVRGCGGGLRGCGGERLAERVVVVEHSVVTRRGVAVADSSCCNGSGRGGSPSSRCMNLPLSSLKDFRVNSSFSCHV